MSDLWLGRLTDEEMKTLARIFAHKACLFSTLDRETAESVATTMLLDASMVADGSVSYEQWVTSAEEEGWL